MGLTVPTSLLVVGLRAFTASKTLETGGESCLGALLRSAESCAVRGLMAYFGSVLNCSTTAISTTTAAAAAAHVHRGKWKRRGFFSSIAVMAGVIFTPPGSIS